MDTKRGGLFIRIVPVLITVAILLTSLVPVSNAFGLDPEADPILETESEKSMGSLIGGHFMPNMGQISDEEVLFHSTNAYFTSSGVIFRVIEDFVLEEYGPNSIEGTPHPTDFHIYQMNFLGSEDVAPIGLEEKDHKSNFFVGNAPSKWASNVPDYGVVFYEGLYQDIDLTFRPVPDGIKYEFVVQPGGDVNDIRIGYDGVDLRLNKGGDTLFIETSVGTVRDGGLYVYQEIEDQEVQVDARMVLDRDVVLFEAEYDPEYPLVIDPLIYSTYIGSSGDWDSGNDIAIDSNNHTYITGATGASDFPTTPGAFDGSYHGGTVDAIVLKLNSEGNDLIYSTYVGSTGHDSGYAIAIDSNNNSYVTGYSDTPDFPVTSGAFCETRTPGDGFYDIVVFKVNADGSDLDYATFVGGTGREFGNDIAVDTSGNAYVVATSRSGDFPITSGAYDETYNQMTGAFIFDGLAFKVNSDGSDLVYSTYLGGGCDDRAYSIVLDTDNNAYITGTTESPGFPTTNGAYDTEHNGFIDSYVFKLKADGSDVIFSTFVGGGNDDYGFALDIDPSKNVYVTGYTNSEDLPISENAFCATFNGGEYDVFVYRLTSDGDDLDYLTYIGGFGEDNAYGIAVDSTGFAYVTGQTLSPNFPVTSGAYNDTKAGNYDLFLLKLHPSGTNLVYSSFYGGLNTDRGSDVVLDTDDNIYVVGNSDSTDFPTTQGAYDETFNGGNRDIITFKLVLPSKFIPGAPLNMSADSGHSFVDLNWVPPVWDGNRPITNYVVYKGASPGSLGVHDTIGTEVTYNDTDVVNGVTYYYAVSAINSIGEGDISNVVEATPGAMPTVPRNLMAVPGNRHVELEWLPPEDDGGFLLSNYTVYRGDSADTLSALKVTMTTTLKDDHLENGKQYFYAVSATNLLGEGPLTDVVNATPSSLPSLPLRLDGTPGDEVVSLTWSPPIDDGGIGILRYNIYRGLDEENLVLLNNTTALDHDDRTVENGIIYYYGVSAVNAMGEGAMSNIFNTRPQNLPEMPVNMTAVAMDGIVILEWEDPQDTGGLEIIGYNLYKGLSQDDISVFVSLPKRSFDDYSVVNNVTYYYAASAINNMGEGNLTEVVDATPEAKKRLPGPPINLTASTGNKVVRLSWEEPFDNGGLDIIGYNIYKGSTAAPFGLFFNTTDTGFNDTAVLNFKTYQYAVSAVNALGEGPRSDNLSAMPVDMPGPVLNLTADGKDGSVQLDWKPPTKDGGSPIKGYRIFKGSTADDVTLMVAEVTDTVFRDLIVTNGQIYYYTVSALNNYAEGPTFEVVNATPGAPPGPPIDLEVKMDGKKVGLQWNPPSNASGFPVLTYRIYKATDKGSMELLDETEELTYKDKEAKSGRTYHYKVTAVNVKGEGKPTDVRSVTIKTDTFIAGGIPIFVFLIIATLIAVVLIVAGLAYWRWGI